MASQIVTFLFPKLKTGDRPQMLLWREEEEKWEDGPAASPSLSVYPHCVLGSMAHVQDLKVNRKTVMYGDHGRKAKCLSLHE